MNGGSAGGASEAAGEAEEAPTEGLGRDNPWAQGDATRPASEIVGEHLDGEPGTVRGELARGQMVEADAVLEVADGVFDLGVSAMVSFEAERVPLAVSNEAVVAVAVEEGELTLAQFTLTGSLPKAEQR